MIKGSYSSEGPLDLSPFETVEIGELELHIRTGMPLAGFRIVRKTMQKKGESFLRNRGFRKDQYKVQRIPSGSDPKTLPATQLVDDETGHMWVAALWAHGKLGKMIWNSTQPGLDPNQTGQFMLVKSEDDGLTWSDPSISPIK